MLYFIMLCLGILSVSIFMILRITKGGLVAMFAKKTASVFFVLSALGALITVAISEGSLPFQSLIFGLLLIAGLVVGMLGDIFLDLRYVYLNKDLADSRFYTFAGFYSFGVGHIFYIGAVYFWLWCGGFTLELKGISLWAGLLSVVAMVIILVTEKLLGLAYKAFKKAVLTYTFILTYMVAFSGLSYMTMREAEYGQPLFMLFIGGIFFYVSDLILCQTYFGDASKGKPIYVVLNHLTYYSGQFLIASSLLWLSAL